MITPAHWAHIENLSYRPMAHLVLPGGELDLSVDKFDSREVKIEFSDTDGTVHTRYIYLGEDQGFYPTD